jgi:hypothetical protein
MHHSYLNSLNKVDFYCTNDSNSSSNVPKAKSYGQEEAVMSPQLLQAAKSFVLNEDMLKIRQAEQVILAEEDRFGSFCRDPEGRLMPEMQVRSFNTVVLWRGPILNEPCYLLPGIDDEDGPGTAQR